MGWKLACLVASTVEYPGLAEGLSHACEMADWLVAALPQRYTPVGPATFEDGAYPSNGNLYVGAYGDCVLIGDLGFTEASFEGDIPAVVETLQTLLPGAWVMALELHSVVDLYGYALFQEGQIVRARAGCAAEGVILDVGEPLVEELPLMAQAKINERGETVWPREVEGTPVELDHATMGEEFVFAVAQRAFGQPLDRFDHSRLLMSEYRPPHTWFSRITSLLGG